MKVLRVLGIDPGTRFTGYGVVVERGGALNAETYGVIALNAGRPISKRLHAIHEGVRALIEKHRPDAVALEKAFYGKNVQSAMRIAEARAVVMLCAEQAGVPLAEYTPAEVKRAAVGQGRAHKTQIQRMVRITLSLREDPEPEDAADALAIALCHIYRGQLAERVG